jgi:hypothetical protein
MGRHGNVHLSHSNRNYSAILATLQMQGSENGRVVMTNAPGLVSESCHESTFKLIRHHNFNDVLFSVGATWTFNKYNNIPRWRTAISWGISAEARI